MARQEKEFILNGEPVICKEPTLGMYTKFTKVFNAEEGEDNTQGLFLLVGDCIGYDEDKMLNEVPLSCMTEVGEIGAWITSVVNAK